MKKISIPLLLALSFSAHAGLKPAHYLTGFYFKGGLGGTIGQFETNQQLVESTSSNAQFTQSVDHNTQSTNIAGLLGMGYMYQLDALWVLGGEFTMGFTSVNGAYRNNTNLSNAIILNSHVKTQLTNDFALLVKPGLAIQQRTLFYALLGPRWGNFNTSLSANSNLSGIEISSGSSNDSAYIIGFTVGLGVERMLTENWGVALEYAYTSYGDTPSTSANAEALIGSTTVLVENNITGTAASSNLLLEASYRF